jgi:hypothetical protein
LNVGGARAAQPRDCVHGRDRILHPVIDLGEQKLLPVQNLRQLIADEIERLAPGVDFRDRPWLGLARLTQCQSLHMFLQQFECAYEPVRYHVRQEEAEQQGDPAGGDSKIVRRSGPSTASRGSARLTDQPVRSDRRIDV